MAFAEIIGVVLDGDAPSAPAGIPTCRHTAFVTAPAGIFLSSSHYSLIKFHFFVTGDRPGVFFFVAGCSVITAPWTCGAHGFNHLQSVGGGGARRR